MVLIIDAERLTEEEAYQYVFERVDVNGEQPERRPLEQTWFANQAYFAGQQWFVEADGRIRAPKKVNPHREYYVANRILPKVIRSISKIEEARAAFRAIPRSNRWEDLRAAQVAERLREYLMGSLKLQKKRARALQWAAVTGSGFLKCTWDPDLGVPSRVYWRSPQDHWPTIEPFYDDTLRQEKEQAGHFSDVYPGDVRLDVVPPYQVYWDPLATTGGIDDCEWLAQVHISSLTKLWNTYGDAALGLTIDETYRGSDLYEEQIRYMTTGLRGVEFGNQPFGMRGNRVRVTEFWERPNRSNKYKGRYILVAGEKVLRNESNPYAATGHAIPFVKIDWFPFEGRFIGLSLVEQLRGPQKGYNRARSHELEYLKTLGYAPTWVPKACGVKTVNLVANPGVAYEYNATKGQPIFGQPANMPPYVPMIAERSRQEMDEISAQADPSSSKLPGQLRSGAGIDLMQKDANLVLSETVTSALDGTATIGSMALELAGTYYDKPRQIKVAGIDGAYDVEEYRGADLRGHHAIEVVPDPNRFRSAESFKSDLMELVSSGALDQNDPIYGAENRRLILEALDHRSAGPALRALRQQEEHEARLIERMIREPDYAPRVLPWHRPEPRIAVLERILNTREFEELDGLAQQKIAMRWEEFKEILTQYIMAQQQMSQSQQGTPGQPGVASQPRPSNPGAL